jgi:uncharacterized protein YecE (DUF72 family)
MLRIGTCSWKYPSWAGIVYSRPEGIDYLAEYARRYNTVEIDQWFWSMPRREQAESYAASVAPGFRFTVKAFNSLTWALLSGRKGAEPQANPRFLSPELYQEFLAELRPLGSRLGLVMLQFEYLNKKKIPSLEEFLRRLDAFLAASPREVPIAVETRNANYLTDAYFSLLRERGAGHVFLQGYWMPPVTGVYDRFRDKLVGPLVVRLHGPDREGMEERAEGRWDRILTPRDEELGSIAEMVRDMGSRGLDVYFNVNNHYEGSAPLTIKRLAALGIVDHEITDPGTGPG